MPVETTLYNLFRNGSRTYFFSSVFFPTKVRADVFSLYGFVRKADNFVDCVPQDKDGFFSFRKLWKIGYESEQPTGDIVIDSFNLLARKCDFKIEWIEAFLDAMQQDLVKGDYQTLAECVDYMYGSAEVVGLMMAKLLQMPEEALMSARLLGRAMQYINFIRDISEDISLGRRYLPAEDREKFGLSTLSFQEASQNPKEFKAFLGLQIGRYNGWQKEAEEGFHFLPRRVRIPVGTASEMYKWTGEVILKDPLVLYRKKVKPSVPRIVAAAGYQMITA